MNRRTAYILGIASGLALAVAGLLYAAAVGCAIADECK